MSARFSTSRTESSGVAPIDWLMEIERHSGWLRRVAAARLGDATDVDDVMQDVSAAAWQSPSRPVQQSKVAPWLYRVTLRRCLTHRRTQGRRRRFLERMVSFYPRNAESTESAWDWLMGTERTLAVRQALQELNPTDRDIFVLKHTESWTYQQLADRLGCTVATIEYRLLRARRQLRKELAALGMAGSPS